MDSYSAALKEHLDGEPRQGDFAAKIGRSQAAVSRYVTANRFPDAETARRIDIASGGAVPFALWQSEMLKRIGVTPEKAIAA